MFLTFETEESTLTMIEVESIVLEIYYLYCPKVLDKNMYTIRLIVYILKFL